MLISPSSFSVQSCPALLNHEVRKLGSSETINLCDEYAGKVILVVNTASKCMFTSQYDGLEKLYQQKKDSGLVVLGFPSNDFGSQEPGSEENIQKFCRINYGVQFPMFRKVKVTGNDAHPFYRDLREVSGKTPRWNFHKYLIGRDGELISSYASWTGPNSNKLLKAIDRAL